MSQTPGDEYQKRVKAVQKRLKEKNLDAVVVLSRPNTRYLSGFSGSSSAILISRRGAWFATDSRYLAVAEETITAFKTEPVKTSIAETLGKMVGRMKIETVGFEGSISYDLLQALKKNLKPVRLRRVEIVERLRRIKSDSEIDILRKAQKAAEKIWRETLDQVRPGMSELEIRNIIHRKIDDAGLEGPSFAPIVAAGPNAALPHHHPGPRKLRKRDVLLIDMGVIIEGYCSDMTRTVFIGKPTAKMREVYETVRDAQSAAIEKLRDGVSGKALDTAAREVIEKAGYGEFFQHGLGHGVGLEIHEAPNAGKRSKDTMAAGMSLTIEPGIYLVGEFGVRIEDTLIIGKEGSENLMSAPKEIITL